MGFLLAKATIDGRDRLSVIAESALPHMPAWTAVDPKDVRTNPWDFEEPEDDATPDVGAASTGDDPVDGSPTPSGEEPPAGNASAAEWRAYHHIRGGTDVDLYSRDELRDHYLNDQPLPPKE